MQEKKQKALLPDRHPTKDFFISDVFDNLPFKDDVASMVNPVFSLSKNKDLRNVEYNSGDLQLLIKPTSDGLPTIFDKDVLLYCGSLLMNEINKGNIPPKTLRISCHDLLVSTNRQTNGQGYSLLKKALDRLKGVSIKTNIKTNKREFTSGFGLIDSFNIVESSRYKDRMIRLEITLSDWFYNSILGKEVLTINRDYFRLGKSTERRLYEIARKHCGNQSSWKIGLGLLKQKTGSTGSLVKFRYLIRKLVESNHLPDYNIKLQENDVVVFENKNTAHTSILDLPFIKPETILRGRDIIAETSLDYDDLRGQFTEQLQSGFSPESVDGAFINFLKKKVLDWKKVSNSY